MSADRFPFLRAGPVPRLLAALGGQGEDIRLVGGVVRNALLGRPITDIDCATTALPDEVTRRAAAAGFRTVPTGIEHGTVTVLVDDAPFEVTTLREDVASDGRRAVVRFGRDFRRDAERRDFTINALFLDAAGHVHDHVGGLADIATRRVRFIGDASTRIREDYLRILRFFRFHAAYGHGPLDAAGLAACISERMGLERLSRERVRSELLKLLSAGGALPALEVMSEAGLLTSILGGVVALPRLAALARNGKISPAIRLAALAVEIEEDVERLLERLRLSNDEVGVLTASAAVAIRLRLAGFIIRPDETRSLLYAAGEAQRPLVAAILESAEAWNSLEAVQAEAGWTIPTFPFAGRDLIALGMPPGPQMGKALARLEQRWIGDGFPMDPASHRRLLAEASQLPGEDSN
jgi:poly(A) polymerase